MKAFHSLLFLLLSAFLATAQSTKIEELSLDELKMKRWNSDSSASAAVLFSKGESVIDLQSTIGLTYKVQRRIKIFKKDAYEEWANVTIRFSEAKVSKLKATTYNLEDGKIVASALDASTVLKKHVNKYTDEMTFAFPNVKEGSVVEYSFTIFYQNAFAMDWDFQKDIPTGWSEYSLTIPQDTHLNTDLKGDFYPTSHETKYNGTFQKWIFKDLPAFKSEPLMPDEKPYISSVNFWICRLSWDELKDRLVKNVESFYGVTDNSIFWKRKLAEIIGDKTDPKQKIEAISKFLKENIEWDGIDDFYAAEPSDILKKKKGSSGDINLLMGSLLNHAGVETDFILLSTSDNGFVHPAFPTLDQFNYVVCRSRVGEDFIFADATNKYLPYNVLPLRCLKRNGLIISKTGSGWADIVQKTKAKTTVSSNLTVAEDGTLTGKLIVSNDGYDAYRVRKKLAKQTKEEYIKDFSDGGQMQVEDGEIQNIEDINKPVIENYNVVLNDHTVTAGDLLYVNPFFLLKEEENPFKLETRVYPLDFETPIEKVYLGKLTVPEGYSVDALPQEKVMVLPDNAAKYVCSVKQIGNQITIISNLQINKTFFMPNEYLNLREFYTRVIAKQAEQIVFKRK